MLPQGLVARLRRVSHTAPPRPTRDERARVMKIYAEDIRVLETMTGRDLTRWRS
jgi:hypothetical protein